MKIFLKDKYNQELKHKLKNDLSLSNIHEIPFIKSITINSCIGEQKNREKKVFNMIQEDIESISLQKSLVNNAKKSVASFNLRAGQAIGVSVTLRNNNMWIFLEKLLFSDLSKIPDFKGYSSRSIDKNNNFSIGIKNMSIFTDAHNANKNDMSVGANISFSISAKHKEHSLLLLKYLGFPIN